MMAAGDMDRKVIVERATVTRDLIGGVVETWATLVTIFCSYVPITGFEAMRNGMVRSSRAALFTTRFRTDITVKDRLSFGGEYWNITFLREIGRREGLEITAEVLK